MVVSRAIRASSCASCRLALLKGFTSAAALPIRPSQTSRHSAYQVPNQRAQFSSRIAADGDQLYRPIKVSDAEIDEFLEENAFEKNEDSVVEGQELNEELSDIPWYLQVDTPQRAPATLSERQRIPDLPEASPEILEPLLKQISIDLGLDDLTLLDLRKLDPPPALGSNLLMILGTARSEKHLHVSADRLCRWLRTNYKLRPDADGLLGRNELKLKLRRKSRRAKLLGNSQMEDSDDGVRTGWVCVNVGMVESPKPDEEAHVEKPGFVGFGRRSDGISIVVQMLTEEKRAEMELEKLWEGILRRGTAPEIEEDYTTPSIPAPKQYSTRATSSILSQTRGFHTSTRHRNTELHPSSSSPILPLDANSTTTSTDFNEFQRNVISLINEEKFGDARGLLVSSSKLFSDLEDGKWRPVFFDLLKSHLDSLPREQIVSHLGSGPQDISSTPFLESFYKSLSAFPTQEDWDARLWIRCLGLENDHPEYTILDLISVVRDLQLCGGDASPEILNRCIRALVHPELSDITRTWEPNEKGVTAALELFQHMNDRGVDILTEDNLVAILEATEVPGGQYSPVTTSDADETTFHLPKNNLSPTQERSHILMNRLNLPPFSQSTWIRLLSLYGRQKSWPAFWETWRRIALNAQPRTSEMYEIMFTHVAESKHELACMSVLRATMTDMRQESPPVEMTDELRYAIFKCLLIAEPHVLEDVKDPSIDTEWVRVYKDTAP